jgi:hypothetical protein
MESLELPEEFSSRNENVELDISDGQIRNSRDTGETCGSESKKRLKEMRFQRP